MSDLYDSLEENESVDRKILSVSGDLCETTGVESIRRGCESKSTDNYSFYLNKNATQEKINLLPNFKYSNNQKKIFLPKLVNDTRDKGLESFGNIIVDNLILSKQGLQMNNDGSFTKSPRSNAEELPFITREYRNLQFQKKKMYRPKSKISLDKTVVKNNVNSLKKPVGITNQKKTIKSRVDLDSNADILNITNSSSCKPNLIKKDNCEKDSDFIDHTEKENLLQSDKYRSNKSLKSIRNLKKTKREMNLIGTQKIPKTNKVLNQKKKGISKECSQENCNCLDKNQTTLKCSEHKISKYRSDILLKAPKHNLNYAEQHQLKNPYNPFCLKQWSKKVLSDTSRSNFGDSAVEELPALPNLDRTSGNITDEDEETFYQKLIERDKNLKEKNQLSFRSDGPLERKNFSDVDGLNFYSAQTKIPNGKQIKSSGVKQISKSLSINLKAAAKPSVGCSKKASHYCITDTNPNSSKIDLILKAKTYGYMVNARNVFNLKAQAKRRSDIAEKNENAQVKANTIISSTNCSNLSPASNKFTKLKSSPEKDLSKSKEKLPLTLDNSSKTKKYLCKTESSKTFEGSQKRIILPRVINMETKESKSPRKSFCAKV